MHTILISSTLCLRTFAHAVLLALNTPPLLHTLPAGSPSLPSASGWDGSIERTHRTESKHSCFLAPLGWWSRAQMASGTREAPFTRKQDLSERSEGDGDPEEGESSSRVAWEGVGGLTFPFSERQTSRCVNRAQTKCLQSPFHTDKSSSQQEAFVSVGQWSALALSVALTPCGAHRSRGLRVHCH